MNKEGYESIDTVLNKGMQALTPSQFELLADETRALVLDTRSPQIFAKGFIPNSINIGIDGSFAPWVGALIPGVNQPILLIADNGREEEVVTRLARVGYDHALGYLKGGIPAWQQAGKELDRIESISAQEFAQRYKNEKITVCDVRKESEFDTGHVEGACLVPLDYLNEHLSEIPKDKPVYLHCGSGYRSMIAASILRARGWHKLFDVDEGYKAISATDVPRTGYTAAASLNTF